MKGKDFSATAKCVWIAAGLLALLALGIGIHVVRDRPIDQSRRHGSIAPGRSPAQPPVPR